MLYIYLKEDNAFLWTKTLWNGTLWEMSFHKPLTASPADSETKIERILWSSLNTTFKKHILISWQTFNLPHWNKKKLMTSASFWTKKISPKPKKQGVNYWQPPCKTLHCIFCVEIWNVPPVPPCNIQEAPGTRHNRLRKISVLELYLLIKWWYSMSYVASWYLPTPLKTIMDLYNSFKATGWDSLPSWGVELVGWGWFLLSWGWILWKGKWEPNAVGAHMLTSNFYYASWAKKLPINLTFIGAFSATKTICIDFLWWRNFGPLPTEQCLQQQGQNHPLRIFKEIGKLRSSPPTVIFQKQKIHIFELFLFPIFPNRFTAEPARHRGKKRKMRGSFGEGTSAVLCEPIGIGVKSWSLLRYPLTVRDELCSMWNLFKKTYTTKTVNMAVIFGPFPKVWAFFQFSGNWKSSTWSRNTLKLLGEMSSPVVSGPESQLQRRGLSAWKCQHQFTQKTDMSCQEFLSI